MRKPAALRNFAPLMKWRRFQVMSVPHKADIDARDCDVRFVPPTDIVLPFTDSGIDIALRLAKGASS